MTDDRPLPSGRRSAKRKCGNCELSRPTALDGAGSAVRRLLQDLAEGDRAGAGEQPVSAAIRERSSRRLPSLRRARSARSEDRTTRRALRARFPEEAEIVDVIVQLSPEAAEAVHGGEPTPGGLQEAEEKLRSLGLRLEPLHARAEDPSLASWFRVEVENESTAEGVAALLRTSAAVDSAYVEPLSAPPAEANVTEEEANAMDP